MIYKLEEDNNTCCTNKIRFDLSHNLDNSIENYNNKSQNSKNSIKYIYILADENVTFENIQDISKNIINNTCTYINDIKINHSSLENIKGLNNFTNLLKLNISSNHISNISIYTKGLDNLKTIDVSCNYLVSLNGIENLINLEEAIFSHNKINNISSFRDLSNQENSKLKIIKLEDNLIYSKEELNSLINFINLEELVLKIEESTNPLCEEEDYIDYIKLNIKNIKILNSKDINSYTNNRYDTLNNNYFNKSLSNNIDNPFNKNMQYIPNNYYFNSQKYNKNSYYDSSINNIAKNHVNDLNKFSNNNIADYNKLFKEIKYKNFIKTQTKSLIEESQLCKKTISYLKEENKNLSLNLQELFKDQRELIYNNEKSNSKFKQREDELNTLINKQKETINTLNIKLEDDDLLIRELRNKIELRSREYSSINKKLEDITYDYNDLNSKYSMLKSDYDYISNIEKDKLIKRNNELCKEINELNIKYNDFKTKASKEENYFKEMLEKKDIIIHDNNNKAESQGNIILNLNKTIKLINQENLELKENASNLNNNIIPKLKSNLKELENELNKKYQSIIEELNNKIKLTSENLTIEFNKELKIKETEYNCNLKKLDKKYLENDEKLLNSIENLEKDKNKLESLLNEKNTIIQNLNTKLENLNNEYKLSLETIESNKKTFTDKIDSINDEKNLFSTKCKALQSEIKSIFDLNSNQEKELLNLKENVIKEKDKENNFLYSENLKLKKDLIFATTKIEKQDIDINQYKEKIDTLVIEYSNSEINKKICSLETSLNTKNLLLEDHSKQIIELKRNLNLKVSEYENVKTKYDNLSKSFDKKLTEKDDEINELTKMLEETNRLSNEYDAELTKVKEDYDNLLLSNNNLKKLTDEQKITIHNTILNKDNEILTLKNKLNDETNSLEDKIKEVHKFKQLIEELNLNLIEKDKECKLIRNEYNNFKELSNTQINTLSHKNQELLNDIKNMVKLREKEKQDEKLKLKENLTKLLDL